MGESLDSVFRSHSIDLSAMTWQQPFRLTHLLQRTAADQREAHVSFTLASCSWMAGMPSGEACWRTDSPLVTTIFIWISFSCFTDNRACKSPYRSLLASVCFTLLALNISESLWVADDLQSSWALDPLGWSGGGQESHWLMVSGTSNQLPVTHWPPSGPGLSDLYYSLNNPWFPLKFKFTVFQ